jgi:hypothetical protein
MKIIIFGPLVKTQLWLGFKQFFKGGKRADEKVKLKTQNGTIRQFSIVGVCTGP